MSSFKEFLDAVKTGDLEDVKTNCRKDYLDNYDASGLLPIHWACLNNHPKILKYLLKKKSNIEARTSIGWRPIHLATFRSHKEIIEMLIDNFCQVDCQTNDGLTPLDIASGKGNNDFLNNIADSNKNREVGLAMGLRCVSGCDHVFCLSSLSSGKFKKGVLKYRSAFGKVYIVKESQTDREFVLKVVKLETYTDIHIKTKSVEFNINKYRKKIKHDRILQFYGAILKSEKMFIFMENLSHGSLKEEIKRLGALSHDKIARYSKEILEGLAFLHKNQIIHRNLEVMNILLDINGHCKLASFALSHFVDDTSQIESNDVSTRYGNIHFLAPEVIVGDNYSYPSDIWSLGAIIVTMLTGHTPYQNMLHFEVAYQIGANKKIEYKLLEPISIDMQNFIDKMLQSNPDDRATAEDLISYNFVREIESQSLSEDQQNEDATLYDKACANHQYDCVTVIRSAIDNKQIGLAMGLSCRSNCDHKFCLSSFSSTNFKKGSMVGEGQFGEVYRIKESKSSREFAIKSINLIEGDINNEAKYLENDINTFRNIIKHNRIVQYFGAIRKSQKMLIFMEYVPNGSIKKELKKNAFQPFTPNRIRKYCKQILEGLAFLHKRKVIHRDIKSDNILLDENDNIKLADFGFSRLLETISKNSALANSFCGTPNYMAPEVIKGELYTFSADIWSMGALLVEMLTGRPPYHSSNQFTVIYQIGIHKKIDFETTEPLSTDMKEFLDYMLKAIPSERATAEYLLGCDFIQSEP